MIRIKYIDPISKIEILETIDDTTIDLIEYTANLHKNYLCKDECNGENCKIWVEVNGEFVLAGVTD